jgi:acylphosphatase
MGKRRAHVWISGRVQGVFFRANVHEEAARRGLAGWVRNLPDGRVEAVFEGDADTVEAMLDWCRIGSPLSRVEKVDAQEEAFKGESAKFEIRY